MRGKRRLYEALERSKPIFNPDDYPDYEVSDITKYALNSKDINTSDLTVLFIQTDKLQNVVALVRIIVWLKC